MGRIVQYDSDGNEHYPFEDWDKEILNTEDCVNCANKGQFPNQHPCFNCLDGTPLKVTAKYYKPERMTNGDRIRQMSDEELDKFLGDVQWDVANYCGGVTQKQEYPVSEQRGAWLDWLKEECKT